MTITGTDLRHLRRCAELAREALEAGDEPFGSLLVSADGQVLLEDRNRVAGGDATRHPEFAIARWAAEEFGARFAVTGAALNKLVATLAPKIATILGQKLAAQAVPVLGAVSGAALNAAFLSHYRELARIRFRLLRLGQRPRPAG